MRKSAVALEARPVEKVWGGDRLRDEFARHRMSEKVGESWEVHGELRVADGLWAGRTLNEITQQFGSDFVGKRCEEYNEFPLLTKWLDCQDWLSVQVHPDNKTAQQLSRSGRARGKSESWYVHRADVDAQVIHGLRRGSKPEDLFNAEGREILNHLRRQSVSAGDFLNTPAGTVHALGPGLMIYEVQQSSDLTYRLYDWGRDRTLHRQESKAAIGQAAQQQRPVDRGRVVGEVKVLTPHFVIEVVHQCARWEVDEGSFEIIVSLEQDTWCCGKEMLPGSALLLPAGCGEVDLAFDGGKCLRVRLP